MSSFLAHSLNKDIASDSDVEDEVVEIEDREEGWM
jgi:hypothetical protein